MRYFISARHHSTNHRFASWWNGTDENGNSGVFPYNFVRELPHEMVAALSPKATGPKSPMTSATKFPFNAAPANSSPPAFAAAKEVQPPAPIMAAQGPPTMAKPAATPPSTQELAKPAFPQSKPPNSIPKPNNMGSKPELNNMGGSTGSNNDLSASAPIKKAPSKEALGVKVPIQVKVQKIFCAIILH